MFTTITDAFAVYKKKLQEFAKIYVENEDENGNILQDLVIRYDWFKFTALQVEVKAMTQVLGVNDDEFKKFFDEAKIAARK